MDVSEVRRRVILALFSDNVLVNLLVLKGGNALEFIHRLVARGSLDVDCSIAGDLDNQAEIGDRIRSALAAQFETAQYRVIDFRFVPRPSERRIGLPEQWGGYEAAFKLISEKSARELGEGIEVQRRNALVVGPNEQRIFKIDISKHEYCDGKEAVEFDGETVYVYTLEMILAEKIRAICQQLPEYPYGTKSARARDFFDIRAIVEKGRVGVGTPRFQETIRAVFEAKDVPLRFIGRIPATRDFHAVDWPRVASGAGLPPDASFDSYFDFVELVVVPALDPLWKE